MHEVSRHPKTHRQHHQGVCVSRTASAMYPFFVRENCRLNDDRRRHKGDRMKSGKSWEERAIISLDRLASSLSQEFSNQPVSYMRLPLRIFGQPTPSILCILQRISSLIRTDWNHVAEPGWPKGFFLRLSVGRVVSGILCFATSNVSSYRCSTLS